MPTIDISISQWVDNLFLTANKWYRNRPIYRNFHILTVLKVLLALFNSQDTVGGCSHCLLLNGLKFRFVMRKRLSRKDIPKFIRCFHIAKPHFRYLDANYHGHINFLGQERVNLNFIPYSFFYINNKNKKNVRELFIYLFPFRDEHNDISYEIYCFLNAILWKMICHFFGLNIRW